MDTGYTFTQEQVKGVLKLEYGCNLHDWQLNYLHRLSVNSLNCKPVPADMLQAVLQRGQQHTPIPDSPVSLERLQGRSQEDQDRLIAESMHNCLVALSQSVHRTSCLSRAQLGRRSSADVSDFGFLWLNKQMQSRKLCLKMGTAPPDLPCPDYKAKLAICVCVTELEQ